MGITQSREYAEFNLADRRADHLVTWVAYFVVFLMTLLRRNQPHIYVANWFFMSFILATALLHIFNNIQVPVGLFNPQSYAAFSGVQDAMTQWWYGHNAVGFFLTAGLPRDDVLLRAEAGRTPDLLLPPVDHPLLGADLPVHVGRRAPPALDGPAGLGLDPRRRPSPSSCCCPPGAA